MKDLIIDKFSALITAAFGLVAALAWNDAIRALFKGPCTVEDAGALCSLSTGGPWIYAIFVTILAVVATFAIGKVAENAKLKTLNRLSNETKTEQKKVKKSKK